MIKNDITKSCVFLHLTLSRLGDKRGVDSDSIEVDADKEFVKVRKVIFKSHHFDAIRSLDGSIRRFIRDEGFHFEKGIHLVPLKRVEFLDGSLKAFQAKREKLVAEFAEVVPSLVTEMPKSLRILFKEEDYKKFDAVQTEFIMSWQFLQFTAPLELEEYYPSVLREEQQKWAGKMEEAFYEARFLLRETAQTLVTSLRERLELDHYGAPKRLSAAGVNSVKKFFNDIMEFKNVTNDRELQKYAEQVHRLMDGVDADQLREADQVRATIRMELARIGDALEASLETVPKRRIKVKVA